MSKKGKIVGLAACVLALAAVAFAYLEWKQSQAVTARYAELAKQVVQMGQILDSGKGIDVSYTYTEGTNPITPGKEDGSLGWPATQGQPGKTQAAAQPVVDLAQEVVDQRDAIVDNFMEKVVKPLECPEDKQPVADTLKNVTTYQDDAQNGMDSFAAFIGARVNRDKIIKDKINNFFKQNLKVTGKFSGVITGDGTMSNDDKQFFQQGEGNLKTLIGNYSALYNGIRGFATILGGCKVKDEQNKDVMWQAPAVIGKLRDSTGFNTKKEDLSSAFSAIQKDMTEMKKQLARISVLEANKKSLQEDLAEAKEEIERLNSELADKERIFLDLITEITPRSDYSPEPLEDASQVDPKIIGSVTNVDKKYGPIILSLNQGQVVEGYRLTLSRKGELIGEVRVKKVTPYNSMAILVSGDINDVEEGDSVTASHQVLQEQK